MKVFAIAGLIGLALAVADAAPAMAGTITVRVTNIRNGKGRVHVELCAEKGFLKEGCPYSGSVAAEAGSVTIRIEGVPEGRYAAQLFHDENGNGEIDRGLFGIPKEGVAFSNDAPIRLGPPSFADAVFAVTNAAQTITARMRYFTGPSGPSGSR